MNQTTDPEFVEPHFRWSIGDLLVAIAILSGFLAIFVYLRRPNIFVVFCVVAAAILSTFFVIQVPRGRIRAARVVSIWTFFASLGCLGVLSGATILNSLLHFVWSFFIRIDNPPNRKSAAYTSLGITLIAFATAAIPGNLQFRDLLAARSGVRPEDMAKRLAYESRSSSSEFSVHKDSLEFEIEWSEFNEMHNHHLKRLTQNYFSRISQLRNLHNAQVESFIKSSGFGLGRIGPRLPYRWDKLGTQLQDIPFVSKNANARDRSGELNFLKKTLRAIANESSDLRGFHFQRLHDFLYPGFFGWADANGKRLGFVPHAFHVSTDGFSNAALAEKLKRMELVSMFRYDQPRVYVLDHMPRMDQLSQNNARTRDLNAFETRAMAQLKSNQVLFSERQSDGKTLALGAIVTVQSCTDCHTTQVGEILGAFSYQFD